MRKFFISMIIVAALFISATFASAENWVTANQITVSWDPVTVQSGTVTYKTFTKPVTGGTETFVSTVNTTQSVITFTTEGRYYLGVKSVRNVDGIELESSSISWSNDPAVCLNGVTFGAQYYIPPANVGGMKVK
jgi:hypothetical protein